MDSGAITCGKRLTSNCRGDTDIRYNADISNKLTDQVPCYSKVEVSFGGKGGTFEAILNGFQVSGTIASMDTTTVVDSRFYNHRFTWLQIDSLPWILLTIDSFAGLF